MKKWIRLVLFVLVGILIFHPVFQILQYKDAQSVRDFYKLERNTCDVIFYGSSHCFCSINNVLLWDEYGMSTFSLAENGQNLGSTYYYMVESLKTQKPKVMCVECVFVTYRDDGLNNGNLYRNTLNIKYSANFFRNAEYAAQLAEINTYDKYELFLKWPLIHSRYSELTKEDFFDDNFEKGRYAVSSTWSVDSYEQPEACKSNEIGELRKEDIEYLDKMVELAEKSGSELVFWVAPFVLDEEQMKRFNALKEYARERNIRYINFNERYEDISFDYSHDMRRENGAGSHVNNFGAEKVTGFMGKYLHENFQLQSHWENKKYLYWEKLSSYWKVEYLKQQYSGSL